MFAEYPKNCEIAPGGKRMQPSPYLKIKSYITETILWKDPKCQKTCGCYPNSYYRPV